MEKSREGQYGLRYHLVPPFGLMNDPNGLVYFKGHYHVFFQWNPSDTKHANKHWGHLVSEDMIHWRRLPIALKPDSWFDKSGVYSGSAIVNGDELWLFYTGNVKDEEGNASSYQCLAVSKDGIAFEKKGPLFEHPSGFTRHVRDPKVWYDARVKHYWLVLGAQHDTLVGDTLVYQSENLVDWQLCGSLIPNMQNLGFMWECPDIVFFDSQAAFIFSPQGIEADGERFNNLYQTVYQIGQFTKEGHFKAQKPTMIKELDAGFDFYAPQTFQSPDDRVILYGWMGIPEGKEMMIPTIKERWLHALTLPRELYLQGDILVQVPISELKLLRKDNIHVIWEKSRFATILPTKSQECQLRWSQPVQGKLRVLLLEEIDIRYDEDSQQLSIYRTDWENGESECRTRTLHRPLQEIHGFLDGSSLEVFINGGEEVFSLRYFDKGDSMDFVVQQSDESELVINLWTLDGDRFIQSSNQY